MKQKKEIQMVKGHGFTARELQSMELPEIEWVMDGIIPSGLTLIAGKPKAGKSYFILNMAIELANDNETVLYLALEDSRSRLKKRMDQIMGDDDWPDTLHIYPLGEWPKLNNGGMELLEQWMIDHTDTKLIVIDTLQKVRPSRNGKGYSYEDDYEALSPLHRLASDKNVSIVVIHHTRKASADDAFDEISGTTGLSAVPDTLAVLSGKTPDKRIFRFRGRDVEEKELIFLFRDGIYELEGESIENDNGNDLSNQRKAIIEYLEDNFRLVSRKDIETALKHRVGKGFDVLLKKMADDGLIEKPEYGKYAFCGYSNEIMARDRVLKALVGHKTNTVH